MSPKVDFTKWGKQGILRPLLVHRALHGPFKDNRRRGWEAPLVSGLFTGVQAHTRPLQPECSFPGAVQSEALECFRVETASRGVGTPVCGSVGIAVSKACFLASAALCGLLGCPRSTQ